MAHFKPKSILNHALKDVTVYKCLQIAIIKSSITEFLISHSIVKHKMCKLAIKEGEKKSQHSSPNKLEEYLGSFLMLHCRVSRQHTESYWGGAEL